MLTSSSLHKQEFKSPAEERLIRKMAKMALNGYEIGIQRKIKPADHIQSMADKIQDTVVTKHPMNSDNLSSGENSRENTLRRAPNANIDRVYKAPDPSIVSIGDKIKETILSNHPANTHMNNVPMPPPIPNSPIPTFNVHSTPIGQPLHTKLQKKPSDFIPKNLSSSFSSLNNGDKSHSGSGYSSSEDSYKDKSEGYYSDTLRKKAGVEKTSFLKGINISSDIKQADSIFDNSYSNTLTKRKLFEKDTSNGISNSENGTKLRDKSYSSTPDNKVWNKANNNFEKSSLNESESKTDSKVWNKTNNFEKLTVNESDSKIWNRENNFEKSTVNEQADSKTDSKVWTKTNNFIVNEPLKNNQAQQDEVTKNNLPNNLYDNSLYTYKSSKPELNGESLKNVPVEKIENKTSKDFDKDSEDNAETETVVRRRQKKCVRNDDGRRDSHIIARPLSTMTSGTAGDMTDGLYPPICHKCDKTITRYSNLQHQ